MIPFSLLDWRGKYLLSHGQSPLSLSMGLGTGLVRDWPEWGVEPASELRLRAALLKRNPKSSVPLRPTQLFGFPQSHPAFAILCTSHVFASSD